MNSVEPFTCDLKQYGSLIGRKEYWDDCCSEWARNSKEEKLIRLGGFVLAGGSLLRIINRYAKDHDEIYCERIQHCIMSYLGKLINDGPIDEDTPLCDRIKRLDKDEIVQLLKDELKQRIKKRSDIDPNGNIYEYWVVSKDNLFSDKNLDRIERHHWRTNPEEAFTSYMLKQKQHWDFPNAKSLW